MAAPFALLIVACGGSRGSSSPTEPKPPTAEPVPLEGRWSGSVTINNPAPATCSLSLTLARDEAGHSGDWTAQCSDGKQGSGPVIANVVPFNQVIVAGLGQQVFGGCGWASLALREGNRMRGDWSTPQNCQTGPALKGRMELAKQ